MLTRPSLRQLISKWQHHLKGERQLAILTTDGYLSDLRLCLRWVEEQLGRRPKIEDLTRQMLQDWLGHVESKPSSIQRRAASLRSFFRFVARYGHADVAQDLVLPRIPKRLPKPLTEEQCAQLMDAPLRDTTLPEAMRRRDVAINYVLYGGGLRSCEAAGLNLEDLQWDQPGTGDLTIHVLGKGSKEGVVVLPAIVADVVKEYLEVREQLLGGKSSPALFLSMEPGKRLARYGISARVRYWAKTLGFEASAHRLRHSCATHMMDNGAELNAVQHFLRHDDPRTTSQYTAVMLKRQKERATCHHPLAQKRRQPAAPGAGEPAPAAQPTAQGASQPAPAAQPAAEQQPLDHQGAGPSAHQGARQVEQQPLVRQRAEGAHGRGRQAPQTTMAEDVRSAVHAVRRVFERAGDWFRGVWGSASPLPVPS